MSVALANPLSIRQLVKHYGATPVLTGIDLQVEAGSICGLVGLNGAGKSTTLKCALGLLPYQQGAVSLFGVAPQALYQLRGKVGVVFDEPCLLPHLSVAQQMQLANKMLRSQATLEQLQNIEASLGLTRYRDYKTSQLSLGNRRRLSIATALVGNPQLLILDEPFNGLDAGGVESLLTFILELQAQGISFLLASHQLSYLERVCTHLAILHQGRIVKADRLDALLTTQTSRVQITASATALPALEALAGVENIVQLNDAPQTENSLARWRCDLTSLNSAELNRSLLAGGVDVYELIHEKQTLNRLFQSLTES